MDRFETFLTTVALINRSIQKIKSQEMAALGLRGTHVMCLYNLGKHTEGLTGAQLCVLCGEDKAAISRTTAELMEKGLLFSEQVGEKRAYRAKLTLTSEGKKVVDYITDRVEAILEAAGKGMTEEKRTAMYDALKLIAENLQAQIEKEGSQE